MAEKKPWAHLDDAINDLWSSFFGASDTSFTLFCRNYSDQRIPESFLEKFTIKLEGWNPTEDPEYKIPKALMSEVFKATKKKMMKKFNKKKLAEVAAEEEKVATKEEKVAAEEEKVAVEEETMKEEEKVAAEEETVKEEEITQEEINKNLKAFSIKTENARKAEMIKRAKRAEKNKATTEQTKNGSSIAQREEPAKGNR